jgi:hypothetical protein
MAAVSPGRDVTWHFRRNHQGIEPVILWHKMTNSPLLTRKTLKEITCADLVASGLALLGIIVCICSLGLIWVIKHKLCGACSL